MARTCVGRRGSRHLYRGKDHSGGCDEEAGPHVHVRCRRCGVSWSQLALFDPRRFDRAA